MKYKTIMFLLSLALMTSMILTFIPIEQACGVKTNGCYEVQTSKYEEVFGIKNAHLGVVAFGTLLIVTLLHKKKPTKRKKQFIMLGLIVGSIVALYFLYLQFFVLNAVCKYCMVTDIGVLLALFTMLFIKD